MPYQLVDNNQRGKTLCCKSKPSDCLTILQTHYWLPPLFLAYIEQKSSTFCLSWLLDLTLSTPFSLLLLLLKKPFRWPWESTRNFNLLLRLFPHTCNRRLHFWTQCAQNASLFGCRLAAKDVRPFWPFGHLVLTPETVVK